MDGTDRHREPSTTSDPTPRERRVIAELGELGEGAWITEKGLADLLQCHTASVKRAVERGELPPPVRVMGKPTWTAGVLRRHMEGRLADAAKEHARTLSRLKGLRP